MGKYPPIEGGVSVTTYWLARGLAERGHEIDVVTNADEVEGMFRLSFQPDDWQSYQPDCGEGRVRVYNAESFSQRAMGHIPRSNPFVSKLASVATDIVRRHGCELILAYYYEPYAVAGWLASRWTGRPLLVKHAGSDLDRLFRVPDLATTYREILRSAEGVVTQPRLMPRFIGLGVEGAKLQADVPYSVPVNLFHPNAEPLNVNSLVGETKLVENSWRTREYDSRIPAIGIYGKIGTSKGTFDLIATLGRLGLEGLDFNFLAMLGRSQGEALAAVLQDTGIRERTYVLPMLPNWRVPAFICTCAAVCFLERDFPIAIHGPIIPREVLACGTCLVLSREIASKQRYREQFVPGENVLIVEDPKDHDELAATLRSVLLNPGHAASIGKQGARISASIEDHGAYIRGWEEMLVRLTSSAPPPSPSPAASESQTSSASTAGLESTVPHLVALLQRTYPEIIRDFLAEYPDSDAFSTAIEFCDFAMTHQNGGALRGKLSKLPDAVRFARARVKSSYRPADDNIPPFSVSDRLQGQPVSKDSVWDLRPVRGNWIAIEEFDYDVSALFEESAPSGGKLIDSYDAELTAAPSKRTLVLFQRAVNLIPCELRIDDATRELLGRCDGTATTANLVDHLRAYFRTETSDQHEELTGKLLGALERLYRAGVVVFGEFTPGWGWTGGARWGGKSPLGGAVEAVSTNG